VSVHESQPDRRPEPAHQGRRRIAIVCLSIIFAPFVLAAILVVAAAIQIGLREWLAYRREEAAVVAGAAIAPTSPSSLSADR
jgi:hypothetical protein